MAKSRSKVISWNETFKVRVELDEIEDTTKLVNARLKEHNFPFVRSGPYKRFRYVYTIECTLERVQKLRNLIYNT